MRSAESTAETAPKKEGASMCFQMSNCSCRKLELQRHITVAVQDTTYSFNHQFQISNLKALHHIVWQKAGLTIPLVDSELIILTDQA